MKQFSFLRSADFVTLVFVLLLIVVEVTFSSKIPLWIFYSFFNVVLFSLIIASAKHTHQNNDRSNTVVKLFRDWYLVPSILFIYTQASSITHQIHQQDYDNILIMIDQTLFGVNPTQWISQFAHPFITEILQIAYSSYYLFFVALFFELYRRNDLKEFASGSMLVVYGFYLSYIGYLLFPAIGPRFTLHDFFSTNVELPGIFLTEYLRDIVNSGGGIPFGSTNPAQFVNRDAFPSGHTQLTMVAMYVAFTTNTKIRWWLFVAGTLLIISTIYLRYHYVVDVMAGIVFFFITIWSGKEINSWWNKLREKEDFATD